MLIEASHLLLSTNLYCSKLKSYVNQKLIFFQGIQIGGFTMDSIKNMVGTNTNFLAGLVCGVLSSLLFMRLGIFKAKSKEVRTSKIKIVEQFKVKIILMN